MSLTPVVESAGITIIARCSREHRIGPRVEGGLAAKTRVIGRNLAGRNTLSVDRTRIGCAIIRAAICRITRSFGPIRLALGAINPSRGATGEGRI